MVAGGRLRRLTGCVLGALLVIAGCGPDDDAGASRNSTEDASSSQPATEREVQLPRTQAGRQLEWFLQRAADGGLSKSAYRQRFTEQFRSQLSHQQMSRIVDGLGQSNPTEILRRGERSLVVLVAAAGAELDITLTVNDDGLIETLLLKPHQDPPAPPESWSALDQRLEQVAPDVGFLAAELTRDGRCVPIHQVRAEEAQPVGSMFKLYVLDTVARQVEQGELGWDTKLTIERQDKSLPSGVLQDRPNGSTVTVAEAARLMISISDNTATDLLIEAVGRDAVQRTIRRTSDHAEANIPLLTTREFFVLKGADYPTYARKYLDLRPEQRAGWLSDTVRDVPLEDVEQWQEPRDTEVVEWFASPKDICAAYAELTERDGVDRVLSENDGGIRLAASEWRSVWFKGGSEPGVLALGYLAEAMDGSRYVLTVMTEDHETALDESTATLELLSLLEGASQLVSAPS